jgi:hypothetical protein
MHIEPEIKVALKEIPVPYEIVKKKDHYFLEIPGYPRLCIANNHNRTKARTIRMSVIEIRKLIKLLEGK